MAAVLWILVALAVVFVVGVLATRDGSALAPVAPDAADLALPDGRLRADDLAGVRFGLALRGYRMREVDEVLDRLRTELADRDAELAALRSEGPDGDPLPSPDLRAEPAEPQR